MKLLILALSGALFSIICYGQNVGIGTVTPAEKLNVDSGSIKIGKAIWSGTNIPFLKFGDANYAMIGEEEGDDKLTIRAKELLFRPSTSYASVPLTIQGSTNFSHFYFGGNEDTYIRGGKAGSNVIINDISGGRVGIGMSSPRVPLEQNGVVGTTAAIFGGEGSGISLQRNWPVVGFNHYYDGVNHKSIGQGWSAILGVNQINGNMYIAHFNAFAPSANANLSNYKERIYFSRFGKVGIGTDDPYADLEISQRPNAADGSNEDVDMGITLKGNITFSPTGGYTSFWNTHVGYGLVSGFILQDCYSFWNSISGGPWFVKSAITTNGNYWQASDRELKKNIDYIEKPASLEKILQLKPASYIFKNQPDNTPLSYGFIAQDLEKIFPGMVMQMKTNKLVSYSSLIPILTAGMQEQQQQIEELKSKIDRLEKIIMNK